MAPRRRRILGVQIACELFELAEAMLRQRLKREHPRWGRARIEAEVVRWRLDRPGAPFGDAPGRVTIGGLPPRFQKGSGRSAKR